MMIRARRKDFTSTKRQTAQLVECGKGTPKRGFTRKPSAPNSARVPQNVFSKHANIAKYVKSWAQHLSQNNKAKFPLLPVLLRAKAMRVEKEMFLFLNSERTQKIQVGTSDFLIRNQRALGSGSYGGVYRGIVRHYKDKKQYFTKNSSDGCVVKINGADQLEKMVKNAWEPKEFEKLKNDYIEKQSESLLEAIIQMLAWHTANNIKTGMGGAARIPRVLLVGRTQDADTLPLTSLPGRVMGFFMGADFIVPSTNIIAMEQVDGTLSSLLKSKRYRGNPDGLFEMIDEMFKQIAMLLYVLQATCLFEHRDLHTQNIMYKEKKGGGYIFYLVDFGFSICTIDGEDWLYHGVNHAVKPTKNRNRKKLRVPQNIGNRPTWFVNECPRLGADLAQLAWNLRWRFISYKLTDPGNLNNTWWGQLLLKFDRQYFDRASLPDSHEHDLENRIAQEKDTKKIIHLARQMGVPFYSPRYFYDSVLDFVPETVLSNHYPGIWRGFALNVSKWMDRTEKVQQMYNTSKVQNVSASQELLQKNMEQWRAQSGDESEEKAETPRQPPRTAPLGAEEVHNLFSTTLYNFL